METLNNFDSLIRHFDVPTIVWLNPFFGDIKIGNDSFENSKICQEAADSLHGIIEMPKLASLFARDFADMQARHQTFEESLQNPRVFIMNRSRLMAIRRKYHQAISGVQLV